MRGAHFDKEIRLDATSLPPLVTWGHQPGRCCDDQRRSAKARRLDSDSKRASIARSLAYMD